MTSPARSAPIESLVARLQRQHQELDASFEKVQAAARAGDWRECDAIWQTFERVLIEHITFEENELFPSYRQQGGAAATDAKRLIQQHAELIKRLEALGDDLQLHHTTGGVDEFIQLLRTHAKDEDAMFHPWVANRQ